jgi:hypothetical protein
MKTIIPIHASTRMRKSISSSENIRYGNVGIIAAIVLYLEENHGVFTVKHYRYALAVEQSI